MKLLLILIGSLILCNRISGQTPLPYKNASLPIDIRVKDLLSRMTREEKFWQLFMIPGDLDNATPQQYKNGIFGLQVSAETKGAGGAQQMLRYNTEENAHALAEKINAIQKYFVEQTRLGIPIIAFDEALHGLVRKSATAFPQSIGLAASFDTALMHRVSLAIAAEARERGIRQILSPVVNIASDVRWGRTEETYGEDPFLASRIAVAYVSGLEQSGVISTPKHFLANVGDGGRDSYPIHWNERLLKEIYLPPFKACFDEGGSRSVMTAYNSIDGSPATASKWLLQDLLKNEFRFKGFVISDASAVGGANVLHFTASDYNDAGKKAIQNGLDVIFQTEFNHYKLFIPAFLNDSISEERINDAVGRVLTAKFQLGLFERPYVSIIQNPESDQLAHHALALVAAAESFVLLQNKKQVLPISNTVKSVALIGEEATAARLGGYSGPGNKVVSILKGLQDVAAGKTSIRFAKGAGRTSNDWNVIGTDYLFTDNSFKENGLIGAYYKKITPTGTPAAYRTDAQVNFSWTLYGPDNLKVNDFYSVQWTGELKSPVTGTYQIGLDGNDGFRLWVDGKLMIDNWQKQSYHTQLVNIDLEKGKSYHLQVQFYEPVGNAHIKLIWTVGADRQWQEDIRQAVELTRQCDMAVIAVGITEGEFQDRALLGLPGHQEALIKAVAATGKPVIVLLVGGSAIEMTNWIDDVSSIVQIWYPGEAGGEAVAALLFGQMNPGGRLPISFPLSAAQLPLVYNHKPTGRGDDYNNLSGLPMFPFGFGLSYTQFEYSDLKLSKNNINSSDSVIVSCTIKNIGSRAGDEIPQLYIHDELSSVARPVMELKGFQRISFAPGETKFVSFRVVPEMLKMYNESMNWTLEPGDFKIMIGSSSRDIKLKTILTVGL